MLVVLAIVAIIAGMVIPMVAGAGEMEALAAARAVAGDLQYAQNYAITHRDPVTVAFHPTGETYDLRSNQRGLLVHPMTKADYVVTFNAQSGYDQVDLYAADFGGSASVTFDELGSPGSGGTVTVRGGAQVYLVEVTAVTGMVAVTAQ